MKHIPTVTTSDILAAFLPNEGVEVPADSRGTKLPAKRITKKERKLLSAKDIRRLRKGQTITISR